MPMCLTLYLSILNSTMDMKLILYYQFTVRAPGESARDSM